MNERFTLVTECFNNAGSSEITTWKIKVNDIHRFNGKNFSKLKSYKFNSPNGEVLIGTISQVASK